MPWQNAAPLVILSLALLTAPAPAAAQHRTFGIGFGMHGQLGGTGTTVVARSGYDPFVLDHRTGRFRYVPIPYDAEPAGSGYNPYRFNWHSARWDYVPFPIEQDYAVWRSAATEQTRRTQGPSGRGVAAANGSLGAATFGSAPWRPPTAALAIDLLPSRGIGATVVSRVIPPPPSPPPPPRIMPHGSKATTRPTLARPPEPAQPIVAPQRQRPTVTANRDGPGWTQVRGVTGRWDYDFQRGRWVFVLPSD